MSATRGAIGAAMPEALMAVIVTGSFTVGAVIVTALIGAIGAIMRRRWHVADAERSEALAERAELRGLRRTAYAELLAAFSVSANSCTLHGHKVRSGAVPSVTSVLGEQDPDVALGNYVEMYNPDTERVEALILNALLVAGDEVARLIRATDSHLSELFAKEATGARPLYDGYHTYRDELTAAMRAELTGVATPIERSP